MSEYAPSGAAGDVAQDARPALTPEAIEGILEEFRSWLQEAARRSDEAADAASVAPEFRWQTLVAEFTALRQEINLQTRAARAQAEQSGESLQLLHQALAALEESGQADDHREGETLRPLLKTLVDLYDALALARRELRRVQTAVESTVPRREPLAQAWTEANRDHAAPVASSPKRRWWPWGPFGRADAYNAQLRQRIVELEGRLAQLQRDEKSRVEAGEQVQRFLNSVITGYTMSLQRIDRALAQQGLEVIACVGEPFDPECMEVVEVVTEPGRAGTEVLEEVRRGYLWEGRLFRHAQVRVARP